MSIRAFPKGEEILTNPSRNRVLEMHNKTIVTFIALTLSLVGWFMWNLIIGQMYPEGMGIYLVREAFTHNYGRTLSWWATCLLVLLTLIVVELIVAAVGRVYWPRDWDLMQRLEKEEGGVAAMDAEREAEAEEEAEERRSFAGVRETGGSFTGAREVRPVPGPVPGPGSGGLAPPSAATAEMRSSFQDRRSSFQDRRSSFQDRRSSFQDRRSSFQERRRPHDEYVPPSFTTLEEEGRRHPFEEAGGSR